MPEPDSDVSPQQTDSEALSALTRALAPPQRHLILIAVSMGAMLHAMAQTSVSVVLPQLQGALSATPDQISWVITLAVVGSIVATPMSGWLVDKTGWRRRQFDRGRGVWYQHHSLRNRNVARPHAGLPVVTRGVWCTDVSSRPGNPARYLSQGGSRLVTIRPWDRHRAGSGGSARHRRLFCRALRLAMDVLVSDSARGDRHIHDHRVVAAGGATPRHPSRLAGIHFSLAGDRRLSADARPGRASRLVRVESDRDLHHHFNRGVRLLPAPPPSLKSARSSNFLCFSTGTSPWVRC